MSSRDGGPVGRREVAYRLFAAEYDDADLEYSDSEEERAPNYVVTPTGARINRLFVVGVLTEVEPVSDDVLRARVVDPTGAFVVYAGQYQPEAVAFLEAAEAPSFVAVTGKARTFQPEGSDRVFTSVRPESTTAVEAPIRDRWTVQAAEHTLARIATMAWALDRVERGDDLVKALQTAGVDPGQAAGTALAIDHYGTTKGYLSALREVAIAAMAVVAGERDSVPPFDVEPGDDGDVSTDLSSAPTVAGAVVVSEPAAQTAPGESAGSIDAESATPDRDEPTQPPAESGGGESAGRSEDGEAPTVTSTDDEANGEASGALGDFEAGDLTGEAASSPEAEPAEVYEMDEAEREAVEEEFGTEFSSGTEIGAPGEADVDTADDQPAVDDVEPEVTSPGDEEADTAETATDDAPAPEAEAPDDEPADDADKPIADEADLEDAAVEAMADLDEGDGAERGAVVDAVVDAHGADPESVEAAIQEALMSGRCYEPTDGRLKAI